MNQANRNASQPLAKMSRAIVAACVPAFLLAGCTGDMSGLKQEVQQILSRPGGKIEPIPEMKPLPKYSYLDTQDRTPFNPPVSKKAHKSSGLMPDMNRPKEALERYPLDALAMQGVIKRKNTTYALIRDGDGVIHEVQLGNHMGLNYGKVVKITDNQVTLEEIVPDGQGGWRKQTAIVKVRSTK